jgi:hypothetical protein
MCGIAGLIDPSLAAQPEALERSARDMANAIAHRGPDGEGMWIDAAIAAAISRRRLATLRDWAEDLFAPAKYGSGILDVKPAQGFGGSISRGRRIMGPSYGPFFPSRRGEDSGPSKSTGRRTPVMR